MPRGPSRRSSGGCFGGHPPRERRLGLNKRSEEPLAGRKLELVFDRMYILRNQVFHGSSTSTAGGTTGISQVVPGINDHEAHGSAVLAVDDGEQRARMGAAVSSPAIDWSTTRPTARGKKRSKRCDEKSDAGRSARGYCGMKSG